MLCFFRKTKKHGDCSLTSHCTAWRGILCIFKWIESCYWKLKIQSRRNPSQDASGWLWLASWLGEHPNVSHFLNLSMWVVIPTRNPSISFFVNYFETKYWQMWLQRDVICTIQKSFKPNLWCPYEHKSLSQKKSSDPKNAIYLTAGIDSFLTPTWHSKKNKTSTPLEPCYVFLPLQHYMLLHHLVQRRLLNGAFLQEEFHWKLKFRSFGRMDWQHLVLCKLRLG